MEIRCPFCKNAHNFIVNGNTNRFQCNYCKKILKHAAVPHNLQHIHKICSGKKTQLICPQSHCKSTNILDGVGDGLSLHMCFCLQCKQTFSACNEQIINVDVVLADNYDYQNINKIIETI